MIERKKIVPEARQQRRAPKRLKMTSKTFSLKRRVHTSHKPCQARLMLRAFHGPCHTSRVDTCHGPCQERDNWRRVCNKNLSKFAGPTAQGVLDNVTWGSLYSISVYHGRPWGPCWKESVLITAPPQPTRSSLDVFGDTKNNIKKHIDFWMHFGSILGPKIV